MAPTKNYAKSWLWKKVRTLLLWSIRDGDVGPQS